MADGIIPVEYAVVVLRNEGCPSVTRFKTERIAREQAEKYMRDQENVLCVYVTRMLAMIEREVVVREFS